MFILLAGIYYFILKSDIQKYEDIQLANMRTASYSLDETLYSIDVYPASNNKINYGVLLKDDISVYANFKVDNKTVIQVYYHKSIYKNDLNELKQKRYKQYVFILIIAFILSVMFALYSIKPMKEAVRLNEEFIKDILHDFNTPISVIKLNTYLLTKQNPSIYADRIDLSIKKLLLLQKNLNHFQKKEVEHEILLRLDLLVKKITSYYDEVYENKNLKIDIDINNGKEIRTKPEIFERMLDNIISNAYKYNKKDGYIKISLLGNKLNVEDSGVGIKFPKKVFNRFYKETSRGIGIGMNIVEKISNELRMSIVLNSKVDKGTVVSVDISKSQTTNT